MCDVSGLRAARGVRAAASRPGWARVPGPPPRCCTTACASASSPNKLPAARWVEIITAAHEVGLRSTVTVMFGHIETPAELAEHMRVVRTLQEQTGGFTEFVPLELHPVPDAAGPHARDRGDLARGEPQAHGGLPARARAARSRSLQASWVKMGLDAATEALRWGVNDLGGTLMEESISRMAGADHGVKLEPDAARRRRARAPAGPPPSGRRCTRSAATTTSPPPREAPSSGRCCATPAPTRPRCGCRRTGRARSTVRPAGRRARVRATFTRRGPPLRARARHRAAGRRRRRRTRCCSTARSCGPSPISEFPPSVLRTHSRDDAVKIVFGSCRVAAPHEAAAHAAQGRAPGRARGRRAARARAGCACTARPRSGRTRCCCSATRSTPTRPIRDVEEQLDGEADRELRRLRGALHGGLGRAGHPLAALDRARAR